MDTNPSTDSTAMRPLQTLAISGVLILTVIRLLLAGKTELIPEEAYYWTYSQHPALSYFDHPPMVAWMIALGTAVFGNTEFGVRIAAITLWPASALLLFLTGRLWFGGKVAGLAVLLFCLCPVFVGIGFIVTPDFPLVFFWLLTLYAVTKALRSGQNAFWVLTGIGFGCAMLSKYTAVMLVASLFLFLLVSANYRFWLLRFPPWLALAIGCVVFAPVIIWNSQHQWASFLFQANRTEVGNNDPLRVEAGTFWLYQLAALTPFILGLFAYTLIPAIRRGWLQREDKWNFSMAFALPLFMVFVLASFKTKGHINWTAPGYLSWSLAAAAVFLHAESIWQTRRPLVWRFFVGAAVLLCLAANTLVHTSLAWGFPQGLAFNSAGAWRGLAREVGHALDELSDSSGKPAFILGADKYNIAAQLGFYLREPADIVNDYALGTGGLGYRYWVDLKNLEGRPAIAILEQDKIGPYSITWLKQHFAKVEEFVPVEIEGNGLQRRKVYLVKCHSYSITE
jgi:dolichol-phosphate mannosyltransferase